MNNSLNLYKPKQMVFPFFITNNNNSDSHSIDKERIEQEFIIHNDINKKQLVNERR